MLFSGRGKIDISIKIPSLLLAKCHFDIFLILVYNDCFLRGEHTCQLGSLQHLMKFWYSIFSNIFSVV